MKKKIKWFLLLLTILFSSCNRSINQYQVYAYNNLDIHDNTNESKTTIISFEQLSYLIDTNQQFALYIHSETCSMCREADKSLKNFLIKNHYVIYSLEYSKTIHQELIKSFSYVFPTIISTPSLFLIKNQKITYSFDREVLRDSNAFNRVAKQHFVKTNISTLSTLLTYQSYIDNNSDYLLFLYKSTNVHSLNVFKNKVFNKVIKYKTKALILDINLISSDLFSLILEKYSLAQSSLEIAVYHSKEFNSEVIEYLLDDGNKLDEMLSIYLP